MLAVEVVELMAVLPGLVALAVAAMHKALQALPHQEQTASAVAVAVVAVGRLTLVLLVALV